MKKSIIKITVLFALLFMWQNIHAQETNVYLSNLSSNNYYDSYDNATQTITGLTFMILSDGDNSVNVIPDFNVAVYIWDGSNPTFVKTYTISQFHQLSSRTYSDQTVDLSSVQLPEGSYRLGVYVDSDDDIPNPPDDPGDNNYLVGDAFYFIPSGSTASLESEAATTMQLALYPQPTKNTLHVELKNNTTKVNMDKVEILNLMGQKMNVQPTSQKENALTINVSNLSSGIYIIAIKTKNQTITKRWIKE